MGFFVGFFAFYLVILGACEWGKTQTGTKGGVLICERNQIGQWEDRMKH